MSPVDESRDSGRIVEDMELVIVGFVSSEFFGDRKLWFSLVVDIHDTDTKVGKQILLVVTSNDIVEPLLPSILYFSVVQTAKMRKDSLPHCGDR